MSALDVLALASPLLPAALLIAALRARRALDALAPLQFAALIGGSVLATQAKHTYALVGAAAAVSMAIAGLAATVLRKDHVVRRAAYSFDWERFERELQFYAIVAGYR